MNSTQLHAFVVYTILVVSILVSIQGENYIGAGILGVVLTCHVGRDVNQSFPPFGDRDASHFHWPCGPSRFRSRLA